MSSFAHCHKKATKVPMTFFWQNNLNFICKTAIELYRSMNLSESDLGVEKEDLEQESCIGLLAAISHFDKDKGIKFLTYAAPSIKNAMTDLIRNALSQFEQRMTDTNDVLAFQKICLDEVILAEERMLRMKLLLILPSKLQRRFV